MFGLAIKDLQIRICMLGNIVNSESPDINDGY